MSISSYSMGMIRKFRAAIDREVTGELGWMDSRIGYANPIYGPLAGSPVGLAHDALEHFTFQGVADEYMAHGAMYWIRYEGGYPGFGKYARPLNLDDFAAEWISLYHASIQDDEVRPCPRTKRLDSYIESDLSEIVEMGLSHIYNEFSADDIDKHIPQALDAHYRGWFRKGYREAARRYGRMGMRACEVAYLFGQIAKAFEREIPECEGQELVLTIKNKDFSLIESEMMVDY